MPRYNLFTKIVTLIVVMLIPIIALYFYTNKISTEVLEEELNRNNINQLIFFQNQVNTQIDLLSTWPNLLIQDPDIARFKHVSLDTPYLNLDAITLIKRIQTKLNIQENSTDWKSSLYIYAPSVQRVVSLNDAVIYDDEQFKQSVQSGWQVKRIGEENHFEFSWVTASPFASLRDIGKANVMIEVRFDSTNITNMLDQFKSDGRGDPFYYKKDVGMIFNRTANEQLAARLVEHLKTEPLLDLENRAVELDGEQYLVNIVGSQTMDWYLIDYMPLTDIVLPVQQINLLFYFSIGCLLLMSCLAAYLLYAGVQVPMKQLVNAFQRLKMGDYTIRTVPKGKGEFGFVFNRFNSMVIQIQELFERVYLERIHVREARLKQLQAQINPHFFYNCFSYISSMAKLNNHKAVIAMAQNLSRYYRYTTRQERDMVSLSDELDFVVTYLEIQNMRMSRMKYSVNIPSEMKKLDVPLLILQPIVENAVLYGVESVADHGEIRITGQWDDDEVRLIVEDNGKGMAQSDLLALQASLEEPMDEEMGCGLWNVHQRLQLYYGSRSGVTLTHGALGGLKVILHWAYEKKQLLDTEGITDDRDLID